MIRIDKNKWVVCFLQREYFEVLRIFLKIRMDRKCFVFNQPVVIREKYGTKHITYLFTIVCIIHIYKDLYVYSHTCLFKLEWCGGLGDCSTNCRWYIRSEKGSNWDLIGSSPSSGVSLCRWFVRVYSRHTSLWQSPPTSFPWRVLSAHPSFWTSF